MHRNTRRAVWYGMDCVMVEVNNCLFVVGWCGRLLVSGDTWSDVNVLLCVRDRVGCKRERQRWPDNPVCLMRLKAGIDWSPNHRRKWAWKWMRLCPWLAVELGSLRAEGMVGGGCELRKDMALMCMGPDFICVWYTVIRSRLNDQIKKGRGRTRKVV